VPLEKSERLLREVQQLARVGSWEWDVLSDTVVWSEELYRIYGVSPRDFRATYEGFLKHLHPDDRERVREIVGRAYRTGEPFEYDHRVVSPDGSVRLVHARGRVEMDGAGRAVRMVGTCQDITELKRTAEALLAAQRRYRALFEQSLAGVYRTTPEGRILEANEAVARMLGYASPRELTGVPAWELYATRRDLEDFLEALRSKGVLREWACRMRRQDGTPVHALNSAALLDEGGAGGWVIQGVLMDVTERHRAEVLARGQNRILEMVARGAPLMRILDGIARLIEAESAGSLGSILLLDPDGAHLRHAAAPSLPASYVEAVDGAAIGPTAGTCGAAVSRREMVVATDIAADPLWKDWRELALKHGLRACWSTPIFSSSGDVLGTFAMYYREPRGPSEADRALVEVATYLASAALESSRSREALEGSTRQLRDLAAHLQEIREEERGRIAREIHDELGQSLTALKMDLAWVRKRLGRLTPPEIMERLGQSLSLVGQTVHTVRRIATDLRPSILDDLGLAAAVEWQAREFEGHTGIRCLLRSTLRVRRLDRDVATAVFRILQEALTNVARHARAKQVTIRLGRQKDDLVLEVADDGRGISAEAGRSTRGIGLLGMRERAVALGGRVSLDGSPGHGTTVRVRVPLAGAGGPPARAGRGRGPGAHR
jgi:PAS domain S-box-containing protein